MEPVTLEWQRYAMSASVANVLLDERPDAREDATMLMLRALVATIQSDDWLAVPVTWWDHFKHARFPAWLKRRFPPHMTYYRGHALFPAEKREQHARMMARYGPVFYRLEKEDSSTFESDR